MTKTAVIFPGQGAQTVGMGRDVADAFPAAAEVFRAADAILEWDLSTACFEGPAERLNATDVSQPAIFVTSVALWRALEAIGTAASFETAAMAGLSLGEYTALHLAGSIGFEDALRLVARRGRLMQDAADSVPGGMVSVMGLDEAAVLEACQSAQESETLVPANFNCPGQIVVSGSSAACERMVTVVEGAGGRAIPLTVAGAFHSPLMEAARAGLGDALNSTPIETPSIPVVSNVSADYHGGPDDIRALLGEQVVKPVRWQASLQRLIGEGFGRFVEVGPGRVLTGLMRKIDRSVTARNYSTAAALDQEPA